jgi:hypothetical protein
MYPPELKRVDKKKHTLPYGTVSGVRIMDVLAFLWQDKNLVRFLTTAYAADLDNPQNVEMVQRRRPRITPQNREIVLSTWGDFARKWLALPAATVRYNFHMNGVDLADQRRSYYSTQLRTVRNWMPHFFWLLDTTIINSFLICREVYPQTKVPWL